MACSHWSCAGYWERPQRSARIRSRFMYRVSRLFLLARYWNCRRRSLRQFVAGILGHGEPQRASDRDRIHDPDDGRIDSLLGSEYDFRGNFTGNSYQNTVGPVTGSFLMELRMARSTMRPIRREMSTNSARAGLRRRCCSVSLRVVSGWGSRTRATIRSGSQIQTIT